MTNGDRSVNIPKQGPVLGIFVRCGRCGRMKRIDRWCECVSPEERERIERELGLTP